MYRTARASEETKTGWFRPEQVADQHSSRCRADGVNRNLSDTFSELKPQGSLNEYPTQYAPNKDDLRLDIQILKEVTSAF